MIRTWPRMILAGTSAVPLALAVGLGSTHSARAADSAYECDGQPLNTVLLVDHVTAGVTFFHQGPGADNPVQDAIDAAKGSAGTGTGSGSGDTVIACHGTYKGNIDIPIASGSSDKDDITVRSQDGPNGVQLVGDGSATPIVSIGANGVNFGGPAEGFTITDKLPTANVVAVQVGIPGAQATTNEDETCMTNGVATGSGCDSATPAGIPNNVLVYGNVITGIVPQTDRTFTGNVTGIELDNTMNATVQQNLLHNVVGSVGTFEGIVVGTLGQQPPAGSSSDFTTGDSTNINTFVYQNTVSQALTNDSSVACGQVTGVVLNGFLLDTTVANDLIQNLASVVNCAATGISSNAYGSLENEQTGTLVKVNVNIDNSRIQQIGYHNGGTAIYLAPNPAAAQPAPQPPPPGCMQNGMPCSNDNYPPSSYTVSDNEIQQVNTAVDVEAALGSSSYLHYNNFDSDVVGVKNGSAISQDTDLDATNDWWGCQVGPWPTAANPHSGGGCAELITPAGDTSWAPSQSSRVEQAGDEAGDNAGQN